MSVRKALSTSLVPAVLSGCLLSTCWIGESVGRVGLSAGAKVAAPVVVVVLAAYMAGPAYGLK